MWQLLILIIAAVIIALAFRYRSEVLERILPQAKRKKKNRERLLNLFREKSTLTNKDVRRALGVSARTVVNYMDELEKEGTVEQIGETGRNAHYRLKS